MKQISLFHTTLFAVLFFGGLQLGYEAYKAYPHRLYIEPQSQRPIDFHSYIDKHKDTGIIILDNCVEWNKNRWKPMYKCKVYVERAYF
jgi:hypothetical protein